MLLLNIPEQFLFCQEIFHKNSLILYICIVLLNIRDIYLSFFFIVDLEYPLLTCHLLMSKYIRVLNSSKTNVSMQCEQICS